MFFPIGVGMKSVKTSEFTKTYCDVCNEAIEGQWDSQVYLGIETGELKGGGIHRFLIYD